MLFLTTEMIFLNKGLNNSVFFFFFEQILIFIILHPFYTILQIFNYKSRLCFVRFYLPWGISLKNWFLIVIGKVT